MPRLETRFFPVKHHKAIRHQLLRSSLLRYRWLLLACLALLASCSGAVRDGKPVVNIVSFSPQRVSLDEREPLEVMFEKPIVSENAVGKALTSMLRFDPPLKTSAHWRDRQTLVVKPLEAMQSGTRYTVHFADLFPMHIPEAQSSHAFTFFPLRVEGIAGADARWFPAQETFGLRFNLPVAPSDVEAHCRFASASPVGVRAKTADKSTLIQLEPKAALEAGRSYEFVCDQALTASGRNAPMEQAYSQSVDVYPALTVAKISPAGGDHSPPDELRITIETSTPVELDAIRKHVHIKPWVAGFRRRWVQQGEYTFYQVANLKASTSYALTVSKKLQDSFGQTLAKSTKVSFSTTDASPRLKLETGIYAVEAKNAGYPVWSRNVHAFDVECAEVPKKKIPTILTTSMDYDPWYSDGQHKLDWMALKLRSKKHRVTVKNVKNKWEKHTIDFGKVCGRSAGSGVYLAQLTSREVENNKPDYHYWRYPYRVLANVTDLGIVLKAGPASGLVWVTSVSSGNPVSGARVSLYSPQGRKVHSGVTDGDGLLRLPGSQALLKQKSPKERDEWEDDEYAEYDDYRHQRMIAVVEHGEDIATVDGNWSNGIQIWNFGVPQDTRAGSETTIRGFLQSDRGIYRPGETVHFKGLARAVSSGTPPRVPSAKKVRLSIEDARGSELTQQTLALSAFGGFSFDYGLSPEASLGDYYVKATLGGQTFRERFSVEEFKPVSFAIKDLDRHLPKGPKDALRATYAANYLFGSPLSGAEVQWSAFRRRKTISFNDYPSYEFADHSDEGGYFGYWLYGGHQSEFVTSGTGRTDNKGRFEIKLSEYEKDAKYPNDYILKTSVRDATDQTVSHSNVVTVHPTDMYLGLHTQEWVQAVDMPFAVNLVAVNTNGQRIATQAKLSYELRSRHCDGYYNCKTKSKKLWSRPVKLTKGGVSTEKIDPKEAGYFVIRLEGKDRAGRDVAVTSSVWVIGEGQAFWSGDESARMSLIASKSEYEPGETARIVPQADVAGATALITYERNGILDARVQKFGTGVSAVEVPVRDAHAPNIFVNVTAVRGRTGPSDAQRPSFHMGVTDLKISSEKRRLKVAISTDKSDYKPGEEVTGEIVVTSAGKPVYSEVALSVADEGVLKLISYQTPDPMAAFYKPWSLGVENGTNWNRIARHRAPDGFDDTEDGADGGQGADESPRSRFVSSAYWAPALLTDKDGKVRFSFAAPDNLTAFRLMAVAADKGDGFGSSQHEVRVRKDLMIKPIAPRFFSKDDAINFGAVVHNYTNKAGDAVVSFEAKGIGTKTHKAKVTVPANGSKKVTFWGKVGASRSDVELTFGVTMGKHRDGFKRSYPLRKGLIVDQTSLGSGRLGTEQGEGTRTFAINWPDNTIAPESQLEVVVDRTGMAELGPSLRYLVEYPYGCLEQTLSRVIPMTKVRHLAKSLELKDLQNQRKLGSFVNLGVAKVIRHQHANGHFSLWPSAETEPHLTAYAMWGLSEAKRAGIKVRKEPVDKGLKAISEWANDKSRNLGPGAEVATMAMAAYVLAEWKRPDAGLEARLFEARAALPVYGKAYLLRALWRGPKARHTKQIETLKSEILTQVVSSARGVMIRESVDVQALAHVFGSDVRSTALVISALLEVDPKHALIPDLVEGLKAERLGQGYWRNTQDNVYALTGLADFAGAATSGKTTIKVYLGDKKVAQKNLSGAGVFKLSKALDKVREGALRIETSAPVYFNARLLLAHEPTANDATQNGLAITRQYFDFETDQPIDNAKVGDLVRVRVTVKSDEPRQHIAVVDPIPSGFEIVNLKLQTEAIHGRPSGSAYRYSHWTHREERDDRAMAFANRFGGERVFEYVMRAIRPGRFTAPGAHAEAMYDPAVFARSQRSTFNISDRKRAKR